MIRNRQIRVVLLWLALAALSSAQNIFTIAGIPRSHRDNVDGQPALSAPLGAVYGLLVDRITGRLLFNDPLLVLRQEPDGSLLALAGLGSQGTPLFDGNPPGATLASSLTVSVFRGMAQDAAGALYLSDAGVGRVLRVAPDGTATTFAGGGTLPPGRESDGASATAVMLTSPRGLVFDSQGNLDIAEVYCSCIRRVTPDGIISTIYNLPPPAPGVLIDNIEGLAIDSHGNLYFTEWFGNVVGRVSSDGSGAAIIAGTGVGGFSGDGGLATTAQLNGPSGVTLDPSGNIYIADTRNNRVRKVSTDGTISTIAGSSGVCGFSGDGGSANAAQLCEPAEILFDGSGLVIADYGDARVRKMMPDGTITTIAGSGVIDPALRGNRPSGDGGLPIHAAFGQLGGAVFDPAGNLYVSDSSANNIRKIAADGTVSTYAGNGQPTFSGDGRPASQAGIPRPGPVSIAPDGSLFATTGDSRVVKITPDGVMHLVAGSGTGTGLNRSQGDGGLAVQATLNEPGGLAFDQWGNIYIADTSNARVRKVDSNGIITTVAGPGQQGVDYYNAVAVDGAGSLYLAWTHAPPPAVDATVNLVNPNGSLTPIAGSGQPCTGGPLQYPGDGPALQARLCAVVAMSVDPTGRLDLSEGGYSLVLRLPGDGSIQRMAGNTAAANVGDGGPVLQAALSGGQGFSPAAVTFDPSGNMYIPEPGLSIIREVTSATYSLSLSPNQISITSSTPRTFTLTTSGNFAEPFPYAVRIRTTGGSAWLSANRVTGLVGESIAVSVNPSGISSGIYSGTVAVVVYFNGISQEVEVPVSLTVP